MTKAFLPTANPSHATVVALTTGTTALPAVALPGLSAYMASKLAQTKIIEFLAAENPNVFAATLHPGMVETDIFKKSGAKAEALPMDKGASVVVFSPHPLAIHPLPPSLPVILFHRSSCLCLPPPSCCSRGGPSNAF